LNTALRTRLLALISLLAVQPLLPSTEANAGAFGDLTSFAKKFPKKDKEPKEGQMLVKFKASVPTATRDAKHVKEGHVKMRELKRSGVHAVQLAPSQTIEEAIARYRADPDVEYAEPNYVLRAMLTPNEPTYINLLWGLNNTAQFPGGTPGADIKAPLAWDFTTGSAGVVVMVIDSGVEYTHQDLAANMWVNPGEIPGNGIDDDGNGYVDDVFGIDVVNGDTDPTDDFGHGTHVAGTLGAVGNNSLGVVGVNWNVKILPCKILDSLGEGTVADAVTCLEYARDLKARGVNIVATNNSYGGAGAFSQTMADAIDAQRDILFVAAAGNTELVGNDNDRVPFYPAGFDLPNVISVAATDHTDAKANFSHFGRRSVHIGAPGVNIWSTLNFNQYTNANGTSMAAPHVAGVAALLKAQTPARDWRQIKNLILSGGDPKPSMTGTTVSGRRVNAFNAVSCANRALFSVVKLPAAFTVGTASTVSALSINCGAGAGPVTATTSAGQNFTLLDDGVAPDAAAGDGVFTATWTPTQAFAFIDFTSVAGTERVSSVDLTLNAVGGPVNANRGDVVALSATLANPSSAAAPASTVNFYLSIDGIITTADTLLGSVATPALAGGAQQALTANLAIPATLATGNYFIGAIVDPANTITEGNETNNARSGNVIAVGSISVDLSISAVSGPTTAFTGDPVTVAATVANLGTTAAAATTLNFYLSSDAVIGTSDTLFATVAVPALAGGASTVVSAVAPIPVDLPPGNYFHGAIVDPNGTIIEIGKANNSRAGNTVGTSTRSVDLTMTAVSGPSTAKDGQTITLTGTVKNQGTSTAPASTIRWYLSTDNIITTADTPLVSLVTASLAGGASRAVSATATVPTSVPAGTYFIGAISDPDNVLAETNNTNNARASIGTVVVSYSADLVLTALAGPSAAATGQNVSFTGTLKNQGLGAINQSVKVGFYVSTNATITTDDRLITTTSVASIAAGQSIPLSVTATLRTGLAAGTYYIGAIADYDNVRAESSESNNALAANTITVTYGPDLVMTAVAAPASATRGQAVTLTGTVKNQGVGAFGALTDQDGSSSGATVRVGFYLSTNSRITANDRRIGTVSLSAIPAGASIALTVNAAIPSDLAPGTYYIGAIADDTGALRESIEVNNALPGNTVSIL
jgi:subtilisin family serine protease